MNYPLLASSEAHESLNPLLPATNELIWGIVCFLVLMAAVGPTVFPKIRGMMDARRESIENDLQSADSARKDAEDYRMQMKGSLDEAHLQSQQILETARGNADRLEEELRASAEDQARRVLERANAAIGSEREQAVRELRAEVGGMVVDLTERVIGESLSRDQHLKLVDQFIEHMNAGAK